MPGRAEIAVATFVVTAVAVVLFASTMDGRMYRRAYDKQHCVPACAPDDSRAEYDADTGIFSCVCVPKEHGPRAAPSKTTPASATPSGEKP